MARELFPRSRWLGIGILLAFFATGFAALLYQVIWQRMLVLFTGSDVQSASLVISAYLAGLGLGTWFGLRLADRCSARRALQVYGVADLLVAAFAILSPWLLDEVLYQGSLGQSHGLMRLWVEIFLVLLCPTMLMGLSLPMVSRAAVSSLNGVPAMVGWLNGINILGAAIGCLVGTWVLVPMTGFEGALRVGACVSAVAGLVALGLSFRLDASRSVIPDIAMSGQVAPASARMLVWPLVFFLSGFLAIALQVVWFRISILVSDNSPLVFSLILAVFLFFDGLGSLLGTRWNWHSPWRTFLLLQLLIVVWAVFSVWWLPHWFYDTHTRWSAFFPLLMVAPAALLIGAAFPVVQRAVQDDLGRVGERVGILQVANLAGNVLAGLLTGLVLLEFWGSSSVFRLAILLAAAAAAMLVFDLLPRRSGNRALRTGIACIVLLPGLLTAWRFPAQQPFWYSLFPNKGHVVDFYVQEKASGTASLAVLDNGHTQMLVNGHVQGDIPLGYSNLHLYMGLLPSLLHPDPRESLIIGLGSGSTAYGSGGRESLERITVVELMAAQYPLHQQFLQSHPDPGLQVLFSDPRYQWQVGDARRWLASHETQFDIIEADAMVPSSSGAGFLYSVEFFELARSRLKPGGIMAQWAPTPRIKRTFMQVFPHGVVLRNDLLIGSEQPIAVDEEALKSLLSSAFVQQRLQLAGMRQGDGLHLLDNLVEQRWGPDERPVSDDINTDWWPKDEYLTDLIGSLFR